MRALSIAALVASLVIGCGNRCSRGPTTTCWCPGDHVGQSTCGEDGLYGACVCARATPAALPPPPRVTGIMMPVPSGPTPPP